MNIRRILGYAVALLLLRVAISFVTAGLPMPTVIGAQLIFQYCVVYIFDAIAVIVIIAKLAKMQLKLTFVHVLIVVLLQEFLSAALISVLRRGDYQSSLWFLDWIVLAVSSLLGIWIGQRLRE